ncbi:MAG TPA: hypothetical protein VGX75_07365 [bacterium]|nr:hypothetical protein [bacterium]
MPFVFFLQRLRPGVRPEDYERWVREFDYPTARTLSSIVSYRNFRLNAPFRKTDVGYQYLEVIEITDLEAYRKDLDSPPAQELRRQIAAYLVPSDNFWGEPIA